MRFALPFLLLLAACGARTGFGLDLAAESTGDAATNDSATIEDTFVPPPDVAPIDAPADTIVIADAPPPRPLRVFVTAKSYSPALGWLVGADAICNAEAKTAGISGTYEAWLSDGKQSPSSRFSRGGPYVRVDGVVVAKDWADLTDGFLDAQISVEPDGTKLPAVEDPAVDEIVWTGTASDGTSSVFDSTCQGWTSEADDEGDVGLVYPTVAESGQWTLGVTHGCFAWIHRLYCFEQ